MSGSPMPFLKMHGLGNDFIIIDQRNGVREISATTMQKLADRRRGIGCDQLAFLYPSTDQSDVVVRFYNSDGSESGTCGNASRCIASLLLQETDQTSVILETKGGLLECDTDANGLVRVNMGNAKTHWQDIPLAKECNTSNLEIPLEDIISITPPTAISMGNPHLVVFSENIDTIDLNKHGSTLEHHPLFPERVNVNIAEVIDREHLRLRVWERGSGITLACGSGACATVMAGLIHRLIDNIVTVSLPGGDLLIEVEEDGNIRMSGEVAVSFTGMVEVE